MMLSPSLHSLIFLGCNFLIFLKVPFVPSSFSVNAFHSYYMKKLEVNTVNIPWLHCLQKPLCPYFILSFSTIKCVCTPTQGNASTYTLDYTISHLLKDLIPVISPFFNTFRFPY